MIGEAYPRSMGRFLVALVVAALLAFLVIAAGLGAAPVGAQDDAEPDAYEADPLGLIAHADWYWERTVGDQVWELWFCDIPLGDTPVDQSKVAKRLNSEISPYFRWLSDGKYRPVFRITGNVEAKSRGECVQAARAESPDALLAVVTDAADGQAYGGGRIMLLSAAAVVRAPRRPEPRMMVVAHEIGHTFGWPHSYGGKTVWYPPTESVWNPSTDEVSLVSEYDNPMDLMSGANTSDPNIATIAVNRYAAGWIEPADVVIHPGGLGTYDLAVPGESGIQMLVLPGGRTGRFFTLGARLGFGYDSTVPRQGVEVYRIDQGSNACMYPSRAGACFGLGRMTQPYPPEGPNSSLRNRHKTEHVHRVGQSFKVGRYQVEVVERTDTG